MYQSVTYDGVSSYASLANGSGYRVSGLVGDDAIASVEYAASRTGLAQAGSFEVLPGSVALSQGEHGNYSFTYAFGSFTVTQAVLRISARSATKVYDGSVASIEQPQVSGLLGSDRILDLSQVYDSAGVGVGKVLRVTPSYSVVDGAAGANYQVTLFDSALGEITQGLAAQSGFTAAPYPVFAPSAVPRFPGSFVLRPTIIDLSMPTKRLRRDLGLDDDEQASNQPALNNPNQGPS